MKEKAKRQWTELPNVKTLLEKVRDGDQESFEPIYNFYKGRVRGYVKAKYYRDPSSTEDITQEVFLRAYLALKRGTLVPDNKLGGFLIHVAKNQMLDMQKIKRTLPNAGDEDGENRDKVLSRDDVPHQAEVNERLGRTIEAIKELRPVERQMLSGSVMGQSRVQIAESVGETPVFVHNELHKTRVRLREAVEHKIFQRPPRVWFRGEPSPL